MKTIISTKNSPAPIGAYNQGVLVNNMLFTSGQIGIDPTNQSMIAGDISDQTRQVMNNIDGILKSSGMTFFNVVKVTVFLASIADFAAVDEVYGSYFESAVAPSREVVQVAALPLNAQVEISMIAIK